MTSGDHQLIRQIEEGALDETTPIASVLRQCLVLGGRAGSTELREWARRELNGYQKQDSLPPYRRVAAPIQIDGVAGYNEIRHQTIGPHGLPEVAQNTIKEEVSLFWGIAQIEDMARPRENERAIKITLPGASLLMSLMNNEIDEFQQITALYWAVSPSALRGVLDRVRTTCTELVAELRASLPDDRTSPSREAVDQALHVAITGERNVVQVVNTHASGGGNSTAHVTTTPTSPPTAPDSWWRRWRNRGIVIGIATVVAAIVGVASWLGWKPPWF